MADLGERSAMDYALEHGGYLATGARRYVDALNAAFRARTLLGLAEDGTATPERLEQLRRELEEAKITEGERLVGLHELVYEFEKRRDRALAAAQTSVTLAEQVTKLLDSLPGAIRVREGGGPEDLCASLAVNLRALATRGPTTPGVSTSDATAETDTDFQVPRG